MHCLWITLCDPDPMTNGQFIYSGGLIRSVAFAGATVTALGLARGKPAKAEEANIRWRLTEGVPLPRWRRLASRYPLAALRTFVAGMRSALAKSLEQCRWDAIVLDSINVCWALSDAVAYR